MNTFFEWMIRNLYKWFLLFEIRFWKVEEKLISSISRQKFFDIHEENCSLLSSTSPAFIYLKFVCDDEDALSLVLKSPLLATRDISRNKLKMRRYEFHEPRSEAKLCSPFWDVTWVHRIIFNFWSFYPSRFFYCKSTFGALDKFCGLCHTILLSKIPLLCPCCKSLTKAHPCHGGSENFLTKLVMDGKWIN